MARFNQRKVKIVEYASMAGGVLTLAAVPAIRLTHNMQGTTVQKVTFGIAIVGAAALEAGALSRMTDFFGLHRN